MINNIETGQRIIQDESEKETLYFQTFMIYLYILSCIKHESFNPETILRTWVTWNCKNRGDIFKRSILNWSWVYRLRQDQVKDIVQKLESRDKVVHEELENKFAFSEEDKVFILKSSYAHTVRKELKTEVGKKKFERNLWLAFEKQIVIDSEL